MLEMRVRGICRCPQHPVPLILLQDATGEHVLVIGVSPGEAERIAHEVRRTPACDPSIFTAFLEGLRFLGGAELALWLNLVGKELVAGIGLALPGRETVIRCAPRDVAVLAAVAGVSVRIGHALAHRIEGAQSVPEASVQPCGESVAEWLGRVRPEDFA